MGHAISLAFAGLALLCALLLMFTHHMENKAKDAKVGKVEKGSVNPLKAGDPEEKQRWGLEHLSTDEILKLGGGTLDLNTLIVTPRLTCLSS